MPDSVHSIGRAMGRFRGGPGDFFLLLRDEMGRQGIGVLRHGAVRNLPGFRDA